MVLSATNNVSVFQRLQNGVSFIDHSKPSMFHLKSVNLHRVIVRDSHYMVAIGAKGG